MFNFNINTINSSSLNLSLNTTGVIAAASNSPLMQMDKDPTLLSNPSGTSSGGSCGAGTAGCDRSSYFTTTTQSSTSATGASCGSLQQQQQLLAQHIALQNSSSSSAAAAAAAAATAAAAAGGFFIDIADLFHVHNMLNMDNTTTATLNLMNAAAAAAAAACFEDPSGTAAHSSYYSSTSSAMDDSGDVSMIGDPSAPSSPSSVISPSSLTTSMLKMADGASVMCTDGLLTPMSGLTCPGSPSSGLLYGGQSIDSVTDFFNTFAGCANGPSDFPMITPDFSGFDPSMAPPPLLLGGEGDELSLPEFMFPVHLAEMLTSSNDSVSEYLDIPN